MKAGSRTPHGACIPRRVVLPTSADRATSLRLGGRTERRRRLLTQCASGMERVLPRTSRERLESWGVDRHTTSLGVARA